MDWNPEISIDASLDGIIRLGWFCLDGVDPSLASQAFDSELAELCGVLQGAFASPADAAPRNKMGRLLYRALGIDPTKNRPSSEALLRRVLTDKPLYRVNSVVDAANFCSIESALPVGLYDTDQLVGDVQIRIGFSGDGYEGISKGRINLEGKLTLCDGQGPFGNPSADSFRTRVREETCRILFIYFAPAELEEAELERLTRKACDRLVGWAGGREIGWGQLPVRG